MHQAAPGSAVPWQRGKNYPACDALAGRRHVRGAFRPGALSGRARGVSNRGEGTGGEGARVKTGMVSRGRLGPRFETAMLADPAPAPGPRWEWSPRGDMVLARRPALSRDRTSVLREEQRSREGRGKAQRGRACNEAPSAAPRSLCWIFDRSRRVLGRHRRLTRLENEERHAPLAQQRAKLRCVDPLRASLQLALRGVVRVLEAELPEPQLQHVPPHADPPLAERLGEPLDVALVLR